MTKTTNRLQAIKSAADRRVRNLSDCDLSLYASRMGNLRKLAFAKARAEVTLPPVA